MAVFKQRKVGFKLATNATPIEGRLASLKELRAKQTRVYATPTKGLSENGRKAALKMIIADKAQRMFESLKQNEKPFFEEMLKEIKLNPGIQ